VVHRDVKPENILLRNDGTCVLSDFGIAHAIEGAQTGLTREGTSVGTPHYMSPEQLRGEHVDARADIYSLGVVLYQLLTGELPYQGTDGWAIGMQHIGAPIPHLPAHLDHLQTFLDALLAKNPDNRLQSGHEVVHWIDARLSGQGPAMTVAMPSPMPNYSSTPPGARGAASIAILPFADLSQTKDQEYLADGLTEELCNLLAKVPGLFVASRSSAARFKGSTAKLAEIGRELKVATVLEGSVRKFGERVRISVQLINVADGFQRWSETYDRTLTDVFAIQDEIAALVVASLKEMLLPNTEAEARRRPRSSPTSRPRPRRASAMPKMRRNASKPSARRRRSADSARSASASCRRSASARKPSGRRRRSSSASRRNARPRKCANAKPRRPPRRRRRWRRSSAKPKRARRKRAGNARRKSARRPRSSVASRKRARRRSGRRRRRKQRPRQRANAPPRRRRRPSGRPASAQRRSEPPANARQPRKPPAARAASERAAAEKAAAAERAAAEKAAAAARAAADKAASERAAAERAAAEKAAADKAAADKAASERAAAEKAAADKRAADQAGSSARGRTRRG
jgi:TolB-like protein